MDDLPPDAFVSPYDYCDGRCQRCPLASGCPVHRSMEQRRWVRTARKQDPDSMEAAMEDITADLTKAVAMLQQVAEDEGIDLDAPLPPEPISLDAVRLRRAGLAFARALRDGLGTLEGATPAQASAAGEALSLTMTLHSKLMRVGGRLAEPRDESWDADIVPNLLLIERLRARLDELLAELRGTVLDEDAAAAIGRPLGEIDRVVRPLIEGVGTAPRALLERMIARGEAPSPFCVVGP